jgi:transcriptional regulator with XRE-family HTH domain
MPAKPLNELQKLDAERLKHAWKTYKNKTPEASQERLAHECGWRTQAAVSQYINGRIPLNADALIKICAAIGADPWAIAPSIMTELDAMSSAAKKPGVYIASDNVAGYGSWPFESVSCADWAQLTEEQKQNIELQISLLAKHQRETKQLQAA